MSETTCPKTAQPLLGPVASFGIDSSAVAQARFDVARRPSQAARTCRPPRETSSFIGNDVLFCGGEVKCVCSLGRQRTNLYRACGSVTPFSARAIYRQFRDLAADSSKTEQQCEVAPTVRGCFKVATVSRGELVVGRPRKRVAFLISKLVARCLSVNEAKYGSDLRLRVLRYVLYTRQRRRRVDCLSTHRFVTADKQFAASRGCW